MTFDYNEAFSRNLGWITEAEQESLKCKRVAIAGLGGVGGGHLLTQCRLGIGAFNIADFDEFELANFNRQAGASMSHLNRPKVDVLREMALDINPELDVRQFAKGVQPEGIDAFLDGVDLYVDSLDFFALDIRRAVFAACAAKRIPAITAAPLGMGVAFLCFMPGEMTFEQYFRLEGRPPQEQALRFLLGLAPRALHSTYLVDESRIDLEGKKAPSTPMACEIAAGIAGSYALKILLNRGELVTAPRGLHFDAYRNKFITTWRPWGNANPIQRLALRVAAQRMLTKAGSTSAT
jgi:molybdopterin/thiamine biosynthesis adenylyltransferase